MNTTVRFLCSAEGTALHVQMPYDEYVVLDQAVHEAVLLRARRKQVADVLSAAHSSEEPEISARLMPEVKPQLQAEPEPVTEPVLPVSVAVKAPPPDPGPVRAESLSDSTQIAVALPPVLLAFLKEQDPSENAKRLIENCVRKLSGLCGKRITLSLHKPYICLWDFDAWITFAYGEIIQGNLFLSLDRALMPEASSSDVWTPPSGLSKKSLVRMKVDSVTEVLIARLQSALDHHESAVKKSGLQVGV